LYLNLNTPMDRSPDPCPKTMVLERNDACHQSVNVLYFGF
jgi:hypothetical protein